MSAADWRFAGAAVVGAAHARLGLPCQDKEECHLLEPPGLSPVLVAVVSDGAGSAARGEAGAEIACTAFSHEVARFYRRGGRLAVLTRETALGWLEHFREQVRARADGEGLEPRDYACTVLAAVVEAERAAFLQIGDGAIVVSSVAQPDDYLLVFWPQNGEYANETYFATDEDADNHLEFDGIEIALDELAILSDGLQRLALQYHSRTAHAPFFRSFLAPVRAEPVGYSERLSVALAAFLSSPELNARTDDDKALVIATRRQGPATRLTGDY